MLAWHRSVRLNHSRVVPPLPPLGCPTGAYTLNLERMLDIEAPDLKGFDVSCARVRCPVLPSLWVFVVSNVHSLSSTISFVCARAWACMVCVLREQLKPYVAMNAPKVLPYKAPKLKE